MGLDLSILKYFAGYIEKELGIIYSDSNYFQLENRLNEVVKILNEESVVKLWEKIRSHGPTGHVKQLILDIATNNETLFFRDEKLFKTIREVIIPKIRADNPDLNVLRFWSAASSFGQEPYSLSILLKELSLKEMNFPRYEIWATDISDQALERAKSGVYSQLEVQRGLPIQYLAKYFDKDKENNFSLKDEIKSPVNFSKMNLLSLVGVRGTFDMILCRNVLIYQKEEKKVEIVNRLADFLTPNGILVLGSAESLLGRTDRYEHCNESGTVYYVKKN